jgi:hypothetical protein
MGKFELASSVLTSAAKVRLVKSSCGRFLVAHFARFGCSSLSKASEMQMIAKIYTSSL